MSGDRYAAEGYKIIQSVEIAGVEIVIADNPEAEKPYLTWRRSRDMPFGAENHMLPVYGGDYTAILREFIRTQSVCADGLTLDQAYRGSAQEDFPLDASACVPDGMKGHLAGKVVAVRPDILAPEYRACSHQLMLAKGGFGCSPTARGQLVYGVNLYSGEHERWNRSDILGVIAEENLPKWAREKLSVLRAPAEQESVMDKIRDTKAVSREPSGERKTKSHDQSGPEL